MQGMGSRYWKSYQFPITDLQEDKTNPYYCKLAIERKKDNENTNFVDMWGYYKCS